MDRAERIDDIISDWYERHDRGEDVSPEDVIRAHPELEEDLRVRFDALRFVDMAMDGGAALAGDDPKEIGDFRIIREIGRGGMGTVYEAKQTSMGRRVALKVLRPSVTNSRQAIRRFRQEARAAGKLHHTNIVPVYGMGEDLGLHFYSMELVEGRSLGDVVTEMKSREGASTRTRRSRGTSTQGRKHFRELAEMIAGVAEALHAAHQEGIVHRDVKPNNLLLTEDGTLKLVDFGLARLAGDEASMTLSGQILGTPHYMSPEQARARQIEIDHRTDIYSLGATLYELMTLRTPFVGDSLPEVCSAILNLDPVPPRKVNPRVPGDLETIALKAMEKDRERRYATAAEMAQDLLRFAAGQPIRARRIGPAVRAWRRIKRNKVRAALVSAVLVLAIVGILLAGRASREAEQRRTLEYERLCAEAEEAIPRSMRHVVHSEFGGMLLPGTTARDIFTRLIEMEPDRKEAYVGRALAPGRTIEQRLADLDAARELGLGQGTWRRGRAHLLRAVGRKPEADAELRRAPPEGEAPIDLYFRACISEAAGRRDEARAFLDRAVSMAEASSVRYLALRRRALLRGRESDFAGALKDFHAVEALGDESAGLRIQVASLWRHMGRESEADSEFGRILTEVREDGSIEAWLTLCRLSRWQKGWHARAAREALGTHGELADLLFERCLSFVPEGKWSELLAVADRFAELFPDDDRAHEERGRALYAKNRPKQALAAVGRALEIAPRSAAAHGGRGCVLMRLEKFEEAFKALNKAVALCPDEVVFHVNRVHVLNFLDRAPEALEIIEDVIAREPRLARAHCGRAFALLELGRLHEALQAAERAIELDEEYAYGHYWRAHVLAAQREYATALDPMKRAHRLAPDDHGIRRDLGAILVKLGKLEDALPHLDRAIEGNPEDAEAHRTRAMAHDLLGNAAEALADAEQAVALAPDMAETHAVLGSALTLNGRHEDGLRECDKAIKLDADCAHAHLTRGLILADELEDPREALEAYERAARIAPWHSGPHFNRAATLSKQGLFEEAVLAYERAIGLDPGHLESHMRRAWLLLHPLRRYDEVLRACEKARVLDPVDPRADLIEGQALVGLGRQEAALKAFDSVILKDSGNVTAWHLRGETLIRLGEFEKALDAFDQAIELDAECVRALQGRAYLLSQSPEQGEECLATARRLVKLAPRDALNHFNLGLALCRIGQHEEALNAYARAAGLEPTIDPFTMALVTFDCLRDLKRREQALKVAREAVRGEPDAQRWSQFAYLCAYAGEKERALRLLESHVGPWNTLEMYNRACIHALIDDEESALTWLEKAIAAGYRVPAHSPADPDLESLKGDPRFEALERRMRN